MSIKEILVPVIALGADEPALRAAGDLSERCGAHVTALIVGVGIGSEYAPMASPLSELLLDLARGANSAAAKERAAIMAWMERQRLAFEVRDATVEAALAHNEVVAHARIADLVVMARDRAHRMARYELVCDTLFRSGRPMLLLPDGAKGLAPLNRILIAWSPTAEAVHAVQAALPLLEAAKEVRVITVDAMPTPAGHGQAPGRELAAYLARHGVSVDVSNLDGLGREHAKAIADAALDFGADLIVMGAYGHSRVREFITGGVTQSMLEHSAYPLLLAH
ncbi:universal stress protein [Terricaulis sp.]|uniref:universal stress protein n=1 Tax=Terricaulis sp. TaxID=2768686 RepID=UPI0037839B54